MFFLLNYFIFELVKLKRLTIDCVIQIENK